MDAHHEREEGCALQLDWSKLSKVAEARCSVVPVAVQDARTGAVLIVAYANEVAFKETLERNVCCLWSTSRNRIWIKGETSGDFLDLVEVRVNCEQNSLLYLVTPRRTGACHTRDASGATRTSCYYRRVVRSQAARRSGDSLEFAGLFDARWAAQASVATTAMMAFLLGAGAACSAAVLLGRRGRPGA